MRRDLTDSSTVISSIRRRRFARSQRARTRGEQRNRSPPKISQTRRKTQYEPNSATRPSAGAGLQSYSACFSLRIDADTLHVVMPARTQQNNERNPEFSQRHRCSMNSTHTPPPTPHSSKPTVAWIVSGYILLWHNQLASSSSNTTQKR